MTAKYLIALMALAGSAATLLPAAPARADVDVNIIWGERGYGDYDYRYDDDDYGRRPDPYARGRYERRPPPIYYEEEPETVWITCGEGKRMLRAEGFSNVQTDNCRGPNYRYTGWKKGRKFDIRVNSAGEINRVRRLQ